METAQSGGGSGNEVVRGPGRLWGARLRIDGHLGARAGGAVMVGGDQGGVAAAGEAVVVDLEMKKIIFSYIWINRFRI